MGNFFHSPRKVTGQNLDEFKVPCKCDRSEYEYQPVTAEGELTLEGVYEQFLLDMQNDRHWARSTCIAYMWKSRVRVMFKWAEKRPIHIACCRL